MMKFKQIAESMYESECPVCKTKRIWLSDVGNILVRCHGVGLVECPGLFVLARFQNSKVCNNPLCEWHKVSNEHA